MKKKIISALTAMCMASSAVGAFTASAADDISEPGHTILDPIEVDMNELFSGTIEDASCVGNDWYSFSIEQASKVTVSISYSADVNSFYYQIVDLDNDNNKIVDSRASARTVTNVLYLTPGNYAIHFSTGGSSWKYEYKGKVISSAVEESFDGKTNNNIGKASEIELDTEYGGIIANNDSADYYKFDVDEEGQITLNFDGDMDNVDWKIYNSNEKVIESGRFSKGDSDDMISAMKSYISTGGTYYLGLTGVDDSYGGYSFSVDYRKDYNDTSVSELFACADVNKDGVVDANDATAILTYYTYRSTGGKITDINEWLKTRN